MKDVDTHAARVLAGTEFSCKPERADRTDRVDSVLFYAEEMADCGEEDFSHPFVCVCKAHAFLPEQQYRPRWPVTRHVASGIRHLYNHAPVACDFSQLP